MFIGILINQLFCKGNEKAFDLAGISAFNQKQLLRQHLFYKKYQQECPCGNNSEH